MLCRLCATENSDDARVCVGCKVALSVDTVRAWAAGAPGVDVPTSTAEATAAPTEGPGAAGVVAGDGDDEARFQPGRIVLGTYAIERKVGRGGMGAVFLASDDVSGQRVAVKVLPASLARERNVRERFIQEARALAALDHPGIVPLITFAQDGDDRYLVMKYVEGRSLEQLIRQQRVLAATEALRILRETCLALDYAHSRGVVHRDIKPANVLVDQQGRVVVVDFGIARKLEGEKRLTQTGMLMGTPQYMAPEQIEGRPVDGRCDLYACGLLLFEMLTGRAPFDGDRTFDILRAHIERPVPDVRATRTAAAPDADALPDAVVALVAALLQKDPFNRPPSGAAVVAIIDGDVALVSPAAARPTNVVLPPLGTAGPTSSVTPVVPVIAPVGGAAGDAAAGSSSPGPSSPGTAVIPASMLGTMLSPAPGSPSRSSASAPGPRHDLRTAETPALALDLRDESLVTLRPAGPRPGIMAAVLTVLAGLVGFAVVWGGAPTSSSSAASAPVEDAGSPLDPLTRAALLSRAQVARENGELDDARVAVDTLLELDGTDVEALLLRSEILVDGNNPDAAEATIRRLPPVLGEPRTRRRDSILAGAAALRAPPPPPPAPPRPRVVARPRGAGASSPGPSSPLSASAFASSAAAAPPSSRPGPSALAEAQLAAIVQTTRDQMRACWEAKVRRDDPGARGEVTLAARVRADGAVVDVKVKRSAFVDRAFHGCLVDAARTWHFPPFDGVDDTVTYRVRFGTADSGPIGLPLVFPGSMPLPTEPASSSSAEPTTGTAVP